MNIHIINNSEVIYDKKNPLTDHNRCLTHEIQSKINLNDKENEANNKKEETELRFKLDSCNTQCQNLGKFYFKEKTKRKSEEDEVGMKGVEIVEMLMKQLRKQQESYEKRLEEYKIVVIELERELEMKKDLCESLQHNGSLADEYKNKVKLHLKESYKRRCEGVGRKVKQMEDEWKEREGFLQQRVEDLKEKNASLERALERKGEEQSLQSKELDALKVALRELEELQKSGLKEASRSTAEMVVLCKQHDDAVESLKSAKQQSKDLEAELMKEREERKVLVEELRMMSVSKEEKVIFNDKQEKLISVLKETINSQEATIAKLRGDIDEAHKVQQQTNNLMREQSKLIKTQVSINDQASQTDMIKECSKKSKMSFEGLDVSVTIRNEVFNETIDSLVEANSDNSMHKSNKPRTKPKSILKSSSNQTDTDEQRSYMSWSQCVSMDRRGCLFEKDVSNAGDECLNARAFVGGGVETAFASVKLDRNLSEGCMHNITINNHFNNNPHHKTPHGDNESESIHDKNIEAKSELKTTTEVRSDEVGKENEQYAKNSEEISKKMQENTKKEASTTKKNEGMEDGEIEKLKEEASRCQLYKRRLEGKEEEIVALREAVHEQRLRVLDTKHEFREKESKYQRELTDLRYKMVCMERDAGGIELTQKRVKDLEKLWRDAEKRERELENKIKELKESMEATINSLKEELKSKEKERGEMENEKDELVERIEAFEAQVKLLRHQSKESSSNLREASLLGQRSKKEKENLQASLSDALSQNKRLEAQNSTLKELSTELNSQVEEMESLVEKKQEEIERMKGVLKETEGKKDKEANKHNDLEKKVSSLNMEKSQLNNKVIELESRCEQLKLKSMSLMQGRAVESEIERKLEKILEEDGRLKGEMVHVRAVNSDLKQENTLLRTSCLELEEQIKILETLEQETKEKLKSVKAVSDEKGREVAERSCKVEELANKFKRETAARKKSEERAKELEREVEVMRVELDGARLQLGRNADDFEDQITLLHQQLKGKQDKCEVLQRQVEELRGLIEGRNADMNMLKEEVSKELTRLQGIKQDNGVLNRDLQVEVKKRLEVETELQRLHTLFEQTMRDLKEDKYRMEETIQQQGKLVDFLQGKLENQGGKKKFFGWKNEKANPDFEGKYDFSKPRQYSALPNYMKSSTMPQSDWLLSDQSSKRPVSSSAVMPDVLKAETAHREKGRSNEATKPSNHKVKTSLFCKPGKCVVCLGGILFVHQSAKCLDCGVVCHVKCLPHLPDNCGSESIYQAHVARVSRHVSQSRPATCPLIEGRLKVNGCINEALMKDSPWREVDCSITSFFLNLRLPSGEKLSYNLCPEKGDGWVVVESCISCVDYNSLSSSRLTTSLYPRLPPLSSSSSSLLSPLLLLEPDDLTLVIIVKFDQLKNFTDVPRVLYLLASSFEQKQKWVASLEAVVNNNQQQCRIRDVKVMGEVLLGLKGSLLHGCKVEINCTHPYNGQIILLGTNLGLYSMFLTNQYNKRLILRMDGVDGEVNIMHIDHQQELIILIAGEDKRLLYFKLSAIQQFLSQSRETQSAGTSKAEPIRTHRFKNGSGCMLFSVFRSDVLHVCMATISNKMIIYRAEMTEEPKFSLIKQLELDSTATCILGTQYQIIAATHRHFFTVQLPDFTVKEFPDPSDRSLSYTTQPIGVLQVNAPNHYEEFLLCYLECGMFVDSRGRRSREYNVEWLGLPLTVAFRLPYIYMVHHNSVHILEVLPHSAVHQREPLRAHLSLPGASYLGPAVMAGAVYMVSVQEGELQIVAVKGKKLNELNAV